MYRFFSKTERDEITKLQEQKAAYEQVKGEFTDEDWAVIFQEAGIRNLQERLERLARKGTA